MYILPAITKPQPSPSMRYILLLEDNEIDRELITTSIERSSIDTQITWVTRREAFIEQLTHSQPDLILADYCLPDFDGIEALELAKSISPEVPFILVSGVMGEELAIGAIQRGATDYVLKQRIERLIPSMQRALHECELRQESAAHQAELNRMKQLVSTVVSAFPFGVITLDPSQRVLSWNEAAERFCGWQKKSILHQLFPIVPEAQQRMFDQCFDRALQGETIVGQEFSFLKQDGSRIDAIVSLFRVSDPTEGIEGVTLIVADNTRSTQAEAQRLHFVAQEKQAKIATETATRIKDEFLATISHELRTPMNAVLGWVKLLRRSHAKGAILEQALETIERNAVSEVQLIEDLLDIARIIRAEMQLQLKPTDVAKLIGAAIASLQTAANAKSIQVHFTHSSQPDLIWADPARLQQVIWNLLSNAIKFTPSNGSVTLHCQPIGTELQIQVSDTGIGMMPNFLPHVFEYFRQEDGSTTRSQGGLGLGLAIARHLVELHGGTIQAESPGVGQGSTFTVLLPLRMAQPDCDENEVPASDDVSLHQVKALVVEDNVDSRELLTFILEQAGAEVQSVGAIRDALSLLLEFQPHVLISDIGLPDEDGYQLLAAVRSLDHPIRDIPAIALTAFDKEQEQRVLQAGFLAHLVKPVDISMLVELVHHLALPT